MEHLLLKAATTATTDQGEFTAIAAAYSVDRVKDRIIPGAFKGTIERWQASGKRIPLHWNHEGDAKSIIGSIDPATARETKDGLYVEGRMDIADSETAKEAWRSVKNGAMSLSFGYMVEKSRKASGGVTDLLAIDLFEVSIVPAPANADTRILSVKGVQEDVDHLADEQTDLVKELQEVKDRLAKAEKALEDLTKDADETEPLEGVVDPLRDSAQKLALDIRSGGLSSKPPRIEQAPEPVRQEPEMNPVDLRKHSRDLMIQVLSGETT
jgi:HK97 family phage prohead protease